MRREKVLDLLELVSENLTKTSLLHSQISCQLQELESREGLYRDETMQEMKRVLSERGKLLRHCYECKESLLFTLKKNRTLYSLNCKKIVQLLKKYSWDSQDKIQGIFNTWNEYLFDLENKIPEDYYPIVELPEQEDFVEKFRQIGQKTQEEYRDNTLIKIAYYIMVKHLSTEPKQESDLNILPYSNLVYSSEKILTVSANKI